MHVRRCTPLLRCRAVQIAALVRNQAGRRHGAVVTVLKLYRTRNPACPLASEAESLCSAPCPQPLPASSRTDPRQSSRRSPKRRRRRSAHQLRSSCYEGLYFYQEMTIGHCREAPLRVHCDMRPGRFDKRRRTGPDHRRPHYYPKLRRRRRRRQSTRRHHRRPLRRHRRRCRYRRSRPAQGRRADQVLRMDRLPRFRRDRPVRRCSASRPRRRGRRLSPDPSDRRYL